MNGQNIHIFWLLLVIALKSVSSQEPLPILELYDLDETDILPNPLLKCADGSHTSADILIVRGKARKNDSKSNVYTETSLYLEAAQNISTDIWEPKYIEERQVCQIILTVCSPDIDFGCYCESQDSEGYYHLVMMIYLNSTLSGGGLRLSWIDARNSSNPPITSNVVDYYNETIREEPIVILELWNADGMPIFFSVRSIRYNHPISLRPYTSDIGNFTFCAKDLAKNRSIRIEDGENVLIETRTNDCISLDLREGSPMRNLLNEKRDFKLAFEEFEGCMVKGISILTLGPDSALTGEQELGVAIGVVLGVLVLAAVVVLIVSIIRKRQPKEENTPM